MATFSAAPNGTPRHQALPIDAALAQTNRRATTSPARQSIRHWPRHRETTSARARPPSLRKAGVQRDATRTADLAERIGAGWTRAVRQRVTHRKKGGKRKRRWVYGEYDLPIFGDKTIRTRGDGFKGWLQRVAWPRRSRKGVLEYWGIFRTSTKLVAVMDTRTCGHAT